MLSFINCDLNFMTKYYEQFLMHIVLILLQLLNILFVTNMELVIKNK